MHWHPGPRRTPLPSGRRASVLARDEQACRLCGSGLKLHVHHIDGAWNGAALRDDSEANLVTLCGACHRRLHLEGIRLTPELLARAARIRSGVEVLPASGDAGLVGSYIENAARAAFQPEAAMLLKEAPCECSDCAGQSLVVLFRDSRRERPTETLTI